MARTVDSESGGLSHYIGQITRRPILSREEKASLVARMKEETADLARRELISAHLLLVLQVARPYWPTEVGLIASLGIGMLVALAKSHRSRRLGLAVVVAPSPLKPVLVMTRLEPIVPVVATNGEALR